MRTPLFPAFLFAVLIGIAACLPAGRPGGGAPTTIPAPSQPLPREAPQSGAKWGSQPSQPLPMTITSPAFAHNARIPSLYTCDGENISPPLSIGSAPDGTKSLVLIGDDPDAPMGTWVHWLLWNIDPKTKEIAEDSVPAGAIEGTTSFGRLGYGGPCPPSGEHRYFFKLYALDTILDLPATTDKRRLEQAMKGHVLQSAELIGRYRRK